MSEIVVPCIKLNNGSKMPVVGLGTYARKADPGQYKQAVEWGIELGYRHIDTASSYKNEVEVGEGIKNKIEQGYVTREDLFVTTKLWNDRHAKDDVVPSLKESLDRLKLDYVDLYLVHWPFSVDAKGEDAKIDYIDTWRGMEEALEQGLTKAIGVSNFNEKQLDRLIKNCTVRPVVNQIEVSPTLTQHRLAGACKERGAGVVAFAPLGLLSDARPEFGHLDEIKTDHKLAELADKYRKSRAQIVLKYLLQRGIVVIPKSFSRARILENLSLFDFNLTDREMTVVDSYNLEHRCVPATSFKHLTNYPF